MPEMIPVQTVIVGRPTKDPLLDRSGNPRKDRDGNAIFKADLIRPEIGKKFDFTEQEVKDILSRSPNALRKPVNESAPVEAEVEAPTGDDDSDNGEPEDSKPKKPAGRKAATKADQDL